MCLRWATEVSEIMDQRTEGPEINESAQTHMEIPLEIVLRCTQKCLKSSQTHTEMPLEIVCLLWLTEVHIIMSQRKHTRKCL